MRRVRTGIRGGLALLFAGAALSCGGSHIAPSGAASGATNTAAPAANVASVIVDGGPTATSQSVNTLFTSVTLCVPGSTTQCQTIDHVQVDTGSSGFRVLASVLSLTLPVSPASDGNALVECTQFVDGYSWGPVALADVQVAGETAPSLPIQVIGAANFSSVPDACASTGTAEDTVAAFGANGILGVGVFEQDCGSQCATVAQSGYYYSCSSTACEPIAAAVNTQVLNPVPLFAKDNNGSIIELPAVTGDGAASVSGSLIFGIDTQTNNASGTQTVLTVGADATPYAGEFTTLFNGTSLPSSFLDSGSNGIYVMDPDLAACTNMDFSGFYCPATAQTFTATLTGQSSISTTASFTVGNAQTLFTDNPTFTALPTLAGTYSSADTFDWGLPFFYGRRVAFAIENHSTAVGAGPYMAF